MQQILPMFGLVAVAFALTPVAAASAQVVAPAMPKIISADPATDKENKRQQEAAVRDAAEWNCGLYQTNAQDPLENVRNGTEMVGIHSCWPADESSGQSTELNDFYAHWSLRELPQKRLVRDYKRESSSAFIRLFVGKDLSMVGSLRIDMREPATTFVIPLASFSYQGRVGKGQNWSTNLVSDDQTLPFFRIGPTSSAQISVTAKTTTTLQIQAASTVLNVLRDLSTIASPGSALVSTLTQSSIKQTAQTLDNALSNVWGESRDESHATARQLSEWQPGARFIIQLVMPKFVKSKLANGTSANGDDPLLTRWYELSLSCPRRSIFSSAVECNRSVENTKRALVSLSTQISAPQVLSFTVATGVSLQQFVTNHEWYSRFLRIGDNEAGNSPQEVATNLPEAATQTLIDAALAPGGVAAPAPAPGGVAAAAAPAPAPATPAPKAANPSKATTRTDTDYSVMCTAIVNSLYAVGLSRLDAQIGLWALVTGSSDFAGIQTKFQSNSRCTSLLPLAGTDKATQWVFATK